MTDERSRRCSAAVALLGLLMTTVASAQVHRPPRSESRAEIAEAKAAHERGDFAQCVLLYRALFEKTSVPGWLYNVAACQFDSGNDAEVKATLYQLLALGSGVPEAVRAKALNMLRAVEQTAAPAASPVEPTRTEAPGPPAAAHPLDDSSTSNLPAYLLGGATLVGLGVSTAFGIAAVNNWHAAQRACPDAAGCADDRGYDLSARARRQGNAATVGFALSAAAGAGTALLFWLGSGAKAPAQTTSALNLSVERTSMSFDFAGAW